MAAEDEAPGARRKPGPRRGFAPLARAAAPALGAAGAKRGIAERRLFTEWRALAGEELSRLCRPVKMVWRVRGEPATLVVSADGPAAVEAAHLADRIAERVNAVYGWKAVARVKVTQTGQAPAAFAATPPTPPTPVDAAALARISGVADEGLRVALARLGENIRRRAARPDRSRP
jgi:hypothetical protein